MHNLNREKCFNMHVYVLSSEVFVERAYFAYGKHNDRKLFWLIYVLRAINIKMFILSFEHL